MGLAIQHPQAARIRLRIAQTTDLHGHIRAFDYTTDSPDPSIGLASLAQVIAKARAEVPDLLLLDNGDALFGNPMADLWAEEGAPAGPHPMIAAMNALGYDSAGLGNHEFNFGLGSLARTLEPARFPFLSANILPRPDRTVPWHPAVMLVREMADRDGTIHRLRIGVIAVMPPQVMQWDAQHLTGHVQAVGMVACLRAAVPALRAAGADLVVVLNHSGIGDGSEAPLCEDAGLAIARLPGVDVVICGHHHRLFPSPDMAGLTDVDATCGQLAGRPAVMAGSRGSHLGIIDLDLLRDESGWRICKNTVQLRPIADPAEDATLHAITRHAHRATRTAMAREIGSLPAPLTSHWEHVGHPGVSALVAAAQQWHARRFLATTEAEGLPLLSAAAAFRCGGEGGSGNFISRPAGPLHLRDLHAIYGFPNDLRVVLADGAALLAWLERVAGQFAQLRPGQTGQDLIVRDFAPYNFDTLYGLSYRFDLSRPAAYRPDGSASEHGQGRVQDLRWQGRPIDPNQRFAVATNNYRAEGGGGFRPLPAISAPGLIRPVRQVLADYIAAGLPDGAGLRAAWGFAALPGSSAIFRTAPQAVVPPGLCAHPRGCDADGFLRVELPL